MNQDEASFTRVPVELSDKFDFTCDWGMDVVVHFVVIVLNFVWVLVVNELPVVQSVTIGILKLGLPVTHSFAQFIQRHCNRFRQEV